MTFAMLETTETCKRRFYNSRPSQFNFNWNIAVMQLSIIKTTIGTVHNEIRTNGGDQQVAKYAHTFAGADLELVSEVVRRTVSTT